MNIKNWKWNKIFFNFLIIFLGMYFASVVDSNKIAVSIVYAGLAVSLVLFNKE
jgi:hypothetical protein